MRIWGFKSSITSAITLTVVVALLAPTTVKVKASPLMETRSDVAGKVQTPPITRLLSYLHEVDELQDLPPQPAVALNGNTAAAMKDILDAMSKMASSSE